MNYVALPHSDLKVSQIAYGSTGFDGKFPTAEGLQLVSDYLEAGGNFLDTAHCYSFWVEGGSGASERFVGTAAKEFGRERFVIATKGGHIGMPPGYPRPDDFMNPDLVAQDLDESLERLDLPQVDLYYLHRDDPRMPAEEIIEATNEHVKSGKVRYLGASNWSVERYEAANRYALANGLQPFVILQNQWSVIQPTWSDLVSPGAVRFITDEEIPVLKESQTPVAAFTPTAVGFFEKDGNVQGYKEDQAKPRLAAVKKLAAEKGATPNQIALAFLLNQPFPVIPILGTRNRDHLKDALNSIGLSLSEEELQTLKT